MGMICLVDAIRPSDARLLLSGPEGIQAFQEGDRAGHFVSLEKAWHGLHYLLTGSAFEGDLPLAFLLHGGEPIGEDDGYGPPRLFHPDEVKAIALALAAISPEELWQRFDSERIMEEGVYPSIWDEPEADLRDEYLTYFDQLKNLVQKASAENYGLLVTLA